MRSELAVESNIYYVPKMEHAGWTVVDAGYILMRERGQCTGTDGYTEFLKKVQEENRNAGRKSTQYGANPAFHCLVQLYGNTKAQENWMQNWQ